MNKQKIKVIISLVRGSQTIVLQTQKSPEDRVIGIINCLRISEFIPDNVQDQDIELSSIGTQVSPTTSVSQLLQDNNSIQPQVLITVRKFCSKHLDDAQNSEDYVVKFMIQIINMILEEEYDKIENIANKQLDDVDQNFREGLLQLVTRCKRQKEIIGELKKQIERMRQQGRREGEGEEDAKKVLKNGQSRKYQELEHNLSKAKSQIVEKENKILQLTAEAAEKLAQSKLADDIRDKISAENDNLRTIVSKLETQVKIKQVELGTIKEELISVSRIYNEPIFEQYDLCSYLNSRIDIAQQLKSAIQFYTKSKVVGLKQLYHYSPRTNYHTTVDNNRDILLLCLTKQQIILGAYSRQPIIKPSQNMIYHEEIEPLAFLYTFSRGKIDVYPLKKDVNQPCRYDEEFVLFGFDEIVIRNQSNDLEIAIKKLRYFQGNDKDRLQFINQTQSKKISLLSYEFLQIQFK